MNISLESAFVSAFFTVSKLFSEPIFNQSLSLISAIALPIIVLGIPLSFRSWRAKRVTKKNISAALQGIESLEERNFLKTHLSILLDSTYLSILLDSTKGYYSMVRHLVELLAEKVPPNQRSEIVREAFQLMSSEMDDNERINITAKMCELRKNQNRMKIVKQALSILKAHPKKYWPLTEIIDVILLIPLDQREEVVIETGRILSVAPPQVIKLAYFLMETIFKLPRTQRGEIVREACRLLSTTSLDINFNISKEEIGQILKGILWIPRPQRKNVVTEVLRILPKVMLKTDDDDMPIMSMLLSSISDISQEERADVITEVLRLLPAPPTQAENYDVNAIIRIVSKMSSLEREDFVTQELRLFTHAIQIDANPVRVIAEKLSSTPLDEREELITQVLQLVTPEMNSWEIADIFCGMSEMPKEQRKKAIKKALKLIPMQLHVRLRAKYLSYFFLEVLGQSPLVLLKDSKEFSRHPSQVLKKILKNYKRTSAFPEIKLVMNPAVDLDGVGRAAVNDAFGALCSHQMHGLPMASVGNLCLPQVQAGLNLPSMDSQRELCEAIGLIFSCILTEKKDLLIGQRFHEIFYRMMHSLTEEDLAQITVDPNTNQVTFKHMNVLKKLQRIYLKRYPNDWFLKKLELGASAAEQNQYPAQLEQAIGNFVDGQESSYIAENIGYNNPEDFFQNEGQFYPIVNALLFIMTSCKEFSHKSWDALKGASWDQLKNRIEGVLDCNTVLQALDKNPPSPQREFCKTWVKGASLEQLKKFVQACTGYSTCPDSAKIQIEPLPKSPRLPTFHTCNKKIKIPNYPNQKTFNQKIGIALDAALEDGFQIA